MMWNILSRRIIMDMYSAAACKIGSYKRTFTNINRMISSVKSLPDSSARPQLVLKEFGSVRSLSCVVTPNLGSNNQLSSGCNKQHTPFKFLYISRQTHNGGDFSGAPTREVVSNLSDADYEIVCEETLDSLTELFEELADDGSTSEEFDVQYASGVLTVTLSRDLGTYVINKQTPNKQIWLSSPTTGPKRYDYVNGVWVYKHDGNILHDLLTREISRALEKDIDFSQCSHGKIKG